MPVNMGNGAVGTQVVVFPQYLLGLVTRDKGTSVDIPAIWNVCGRLGLCQWCFHGEVFGTCFTAGQETVPLLGI